MCSPPIGGWRGNSGSIVESGEHVKIQQIWLAGLVKRYHIAQLIGEQNTGAHSWGVAVICMLFWPDRTELLRAALVHDLGEQKTGDIPASLKKDNPELEDMLSRAEEDHLHTLGVLRHLRVLSESDQVRLEIADRLEAIFFCTNQIFLGNTRIAPIKTRNVELAWHALAKLPDDDGAKQITDFLVNNI